MKSKGAIFWFLVSLALAGVLAVQWSRGKRQQETLESLQLQVEKASIDMRSTQTELADLQKERAELRAELVETQTAAKSSSSPEPVTQAPRVTTGVEQRSGVTRAPAANSPAGKPNMANMLGNMLKDPEMRKAMAQQQRVGLNLVYGSLFKELQLSSDQEQKVKDILVEQQMDNMSQAGALMDAGTTNRAEITAKLDEDRKLREGQLKEALGEEKFSQYQDYQQTLGERMLLEQFGGELTLSPEQKTQLIGIMQDEKKNNQINTGVDPGALSKDPQAVLGSAEAMDKIVAQQEQVNARVLERAGQVLSPEQIRKLEPVLKTQLDLQRAGAKMARQMFGGETQPGEK